MKARLLFAMFALGFLLPPSGAYAQNQYPYQYYLPHFVNGGSNVVYKTSFIVFNNSGTVVTATLILTDNAGNPLTANIPGLGSGSQFAIQLGPGVTQIYQSDGLGSGSQGAATLSSTGPIGVSAVFTVLDSSGNFISEAGIGASEAMTDFVLPVDSTGSALTGLALYNPGATEASLTLTLFDTGGNQAGTMPVMLGAGNHMAAFVALDDPGQFFPTLSSFQGIMRVQSTAPISALVLRQTQTAKTTCYTSLPVVARSSTKTQLNLAQVADGGSAAITFKTSFLIFNFSAAPANITLALTDNSGNPLSVNIPGNGIGTGSGASRGFTLPPNASVFLQTDGSSAGNSGAAEITSNVPVGASAIFTVFNDGAFQTEAGVGDSSALISLTLPVDITGLSDTGMAFFNPGSSSSALTFTLLDESGAVKGTTTINLAGSGHLAEFVDQLFPGTNNFIGSLAVSASFGVASTVLRQYNSGANYTSLPTVWGTATAQASPSASIVAERALAQTGLAIGQATEVLMSQLDMIVAIEEEETSCESLDGGGSVLWDTTTATVYYDSSCTTPYLSTNPKLTSGNGQLSASETVTYYGLNGTIIGSMTLNETAIVGETSTTVYGLGVFTPSSGAQTPVQLGLYCTLSSGEGQCGGGIAQNFADLGLAIGAVTPITLSYTSTSSPVTFSGGGSAVAGPIGSLTLTNPSETSLVIQGGALFAATAANGGAAEFALFPPTPTGWTLTDSTHDEQIQITVVDNTTRNLSATITQISTGNTLATGTIDQSGSGTITWSDGTVATITNWTLAAQQ